MDPAATPAPAAPESSAPVAPVAPVTPTPTPVQPAVEPATPTAEDATQNADDQEWADAHENEFKDRVKKDEPAKPKEGTEAAKTGSEVPTDEKADEGQGDDNGAKQQGEDGTPANADSAATAARQARNAARESAEQVKTFSNDVREKMFSTVPEQVQDAEGRPIKTLEDVQNYINPQTKEAFTEEEAAYWLMNAQQQLRETKADTDKQIEDIAQVNIRIKDEADVINSKYETYLKENPDIRKSLWAQYAKTLTVDEASGVITKAPVSLEEFYELALEPRVAAAQPKPAASVATPTQTPEQVAATEAAAKVEADKARQQKRADRSDVYMPPTDPNLDPEEKEWADAHKAEFGDRLPKG